MDKFFREALVSGGVYSGYSDFWSLPVDARVKNISLEASEVTSSGRRLMTTG